MKNGLLMPIGMSILLALGLGAQTANADDQTATVTWESGHIKCGDFGHLGPGDSLTITNASGVDIWVRWDDETEYTLVATGSSLVLSNVGTDAQDHYHARNTPPGPLPEECMGSETVMIPAVSEWGLVVMTLLLLTAGTIIVARQRRRRPAAA